MSQKIAVLAGHVKCGTTFLDHTARSGDVAVFGSSDVERLTPAMMRERAEGRPTYAYHQNAVSIPEYMDQLRLLAGDEGPVFVVYRNPIDAALSVVQQMMHGHDGDFDAGLTRRILFPAKPLDRPVQSFLRGPFREIVADRFDYLRSARSVRAAFGAERVREFVFERMIADPEPASKTLSDALGVALEPPRQPVNVTYTPRSRLIYKVANKAFATLTGLDSAVLRDAVTDEGARGLLPGSTA